MPSKSKKASFSWCVFLKWWALLLVKWGTGLFKTGLRSKLLTQGRVGTRRCPEMDNLLDDYLFKLSIDEDVNWSAAFDSFISVLKNCCNQTTSIWTLWNLYPNRCSFIFLFLKLGHQVFQALHTFFGAYVRPGWSHIEQYITSIHSFDTTLDKLSALTCEVVDAALASLCTQAMSKEAEGWVHGGRAPHLPHFRVP